MDKNELLKIIDVCKALARLIKMDCRGRLLNQQNLEEIIDTSLLEIIEGLKDILKEDVVDSDPCKDAYVKGGVVYGCKCGKCF